MSEDQNIAVTKYYIYKTTNVCCADRVLHIHIRHWQYWQTFNTIQCKYHKSEDGQQNSTDVYYVPLTLDRQHHRTILQFTNTVHSVSTNKTVLIFREPTVELWHTMLHTR